MLLLELKRLSFTKIGTFGVLSKVTGDGSYPWMVTLEDPWNNNEPFKSCIPAGVYTCKRAYYNAGKYWTFEVTGVDGRTHILFHIGNTILNTEGCILLGDSFNSSGISLSQMAHEDFMKRLENFSEFQLVIKDPV